MIAAAAAVAPADSGKSDICRNAAVICEGMLVAGGSGYAVGGKHLSPYRSSSVQWTHSGHWCSS